jgi:predicted house-cleaning noncanonical NTP pyrophosphatase (MazG superfamily)
MNTNVVTNETFEMKMSKRIKDSIGDLISDEELTKLVHRGLEEVFFTPRKNPKKSYYNDNHPETIPPLIHEIVKEVLQPMVTEAIKEYVKAHNNEILKVVNDVVTAGVGNAVMTAMNMQFQSQLISFQSSIQNQLINK